METNFKRIMAHIVASIRKAGYEPYDQLYGYLKTGDETYITRTGDARNLIKTLDRGQLQGYTDKSLGEISSYLCFSNQSHFQNVFKKNYGITPLEYRRQQ